MGMRGTYGFGRADALMTAGRMLLAVRGLREGVACVEQALDEYQRALDQVLAKHMAKEAVGASGGLSEEDWLTWDCCRGRIDATVETCRNLGYRAVRGADGLWRVRFGL